MKYLQSYYLYGKDAAAMEFLSGGAYAQMGKSAQNLIQCISDCMDFPK